MLVYRRFVERQLLECQDVLDYVLLRPIGGGTHVQHLYIYDSQIIHSLHAVVVAFCSVLVLPSFEWKAVLLVVASHSQCFAFSLLFALIANVFCYFERATTNILFLLRT